MKETKILIVLEDTNRGGAETQALLLAKGLLSKGYILEILAFGSTKGSYWVEFNNLGVPIHLTGFRSKLIISPEKGIKGYFIRMKYILRLIFQVRKIQPTIILPFTYPPNIIMGQFWRYMGAKKCFWNQRDEGRMFLGKNSEIEILNSSSAIVSNSKEGADFLKQHTKKKIRIIHNGVNLPEVKSKQINSNTINVIMIANFHSYKDHITLLKAWKLVVNKFKFKNVTLVLAGREGDESDTINNFIKENKLIESVKIVGLISNVNHVLSNSDIGVFSSFKEGLPNGILECMAAGLPVVATRMNGSIEALGEDYPFLANPKDAEGMAQHLLFLLDSEVERKRIGQQNRERIENHFTTEKMVANYELLFKE